MVALSQVKLGDKIAEDVLTPLGGVLFNKGKIITQREIEIMQAFLVSAVVTDTGNVLSAKSKEDEQVEPKPSEQIYSVFNNEYDQMIALLKKVYNDFASGQGMPVMDIRVQLENMLKHIKNYNVLAFIPRNFQHRDYLIHNSVSCALTSYLIAQWVGLPQKDWMQVALAGLLHDVGNTRLDRSILTKPSALTAEEVEERKRHPSLGYQLLRNVAALNEGVKMAALQHHEREDGSGYPVGSDGSKIHPYAKIVAIADIFHAMTMDKSYRKAASPYLVLEQIQSDSFGKLEPSYVRTFVEKVTQFHNGTIVRLNNERIGEIVFTDHNHPTRPWVNVEGTIINLTTERSLFIVEVIG